MSLGKDMRQEPVSELSLREAITVKPETSVREAVRLMQAQELGCVVVVDDESRPSGIFTESVLMNVLIAGNQLDDPVAEHLAAQMAVVRRSDPIVRVLRAMQQYDQRFVVVTDDDGRVEALTGQKGLMEYVAEHFPKQVMVQRIGSPVIQDREGA